MAIAMAEYWRCSSSRTMMPSLPRQCEPSESQLHMSFMRARPRCHGVAKRVAMTITMSKAMASSTQPTTPTTIGSAKSREKPSVKS